MAIKFDGLSSTDFEEFCADLLNATGFVNVDWRKGTGLATSPADKGRDIVCDHPRKEPDGSQHFERWFVDCKHFKRGVPPKDLQNMLAWAEAERPDVALFIVSNFLSNPAKDYLDTYRKNNRPPFKIRCWERPQLARMLGRKMSLQRKYDLTDIPIRSVKQILAAENELFTRVWYGRKMPAKLSCAIYISLQVDELYALILQSVPDAAKYAMLPRWMKKGIEQKRTDAQASEGN
jgi:restriction endonuclease